MENCKILKISWDFSEFWLEKANINKKIKAILMEFWKGLISLK